MMAPLLEVSGLTAGYGSVRGISDLSFSLDAGEALALLGPNGAGKTTALEAITGLLPKISGTVRYDGRDFTRRSMASLVHAGVALVPQWRDLFAEFTVTETIEAARLGSRRKSSFDRDAIFALFPQLAQRASSAAGNLSGGERQMLAIGRALATGPKLLLIDELSGGLAVGIADALVATLRRIMETGLSLIVVEQNVELAADLASRTIILNAGRSVWAGSLDHARAADILQRAYFNAA